MLNSSHIVVTIADGGVEDGSASYASPATDISCAIRDWTLSIGATRISSTTRCATIETTAFLRERGTITCTVDIPDSGTPHFGTTAKRYFQIVVKEITSATARTYNCVLTQNELSSPMDALQRQSVTLEIQAVS